MAYVAISNQLLDEVRNKIRRMQDAEFESMPKVESSFSSQTLPPDIDQLVWGEHYHLKNVIPSTWKRQVNEFCGTAEYEYNEKKQKSSIYYKTAVKCDSPPNNSSYTAYFTMPETHPHMALVIESDKQRLDLNAKWQQLSNKIRTFLVNCKSLNEAVKLWPDVRMYIPQSYMDRMLAKSERTAEKISKASEFLKQIDTDHAVAAAVGARMAGAKV